MKRIYHFIKHEVKIYLMFRKLTPAQIEAFHRQAALVESTKRNHATPKPPPARPRFELTTTGPHGLAFLQEVTK